MGWSAPDKKYEIPVLTIRVQRYFDWNGLWFNNVNQSYVPCVAFPGADAANLLPDDLFRFFRE